MSVHQERLDDLTTAQTAAARNPFVRAVQVLRREGLRVFGIKLMSRLGLYRKVVLLERPLDGMLPESAPTLPMRIDLLKENEVDDYLALRPEAVRSSVVDRLRAGCMCFVARHEGCVVSACWAAIHHARDEFLARDIELAAGDAYLFDAFTDPRHRGQGVAPALCLHQLRYLQQAGFRRALRFTFLLNTTALRTHAKSGFRPVGTLSRLKIGPWRRYFRRPWSGKDQAP